MDIVESLDGLMTDWLIIAGTILAAVSGVPGLWEDRKGSTAAARGERTATLLMVLGAVCGIAGAVLAGVTGIAQFLSTRDQTRRETGVHAALNNGALTLYLLSLGLRRTGRRRLARTVSATALGIVAASGYLGGDLSYRHGVGVTGTGG